MGELFIGAVVHFAYNLGFGGPPVCVPAVVTFIYDQKTGNIAARELQTLDMKSMLYAAGGEAGTWHWPEKDVKEML